MRPGSVGIVCLLLLTAASPFVTAGVGYDNPLAVYLTFPAGPYEVGSDVPVTIHVFKEGVRHDPDVVNLTVGEANREIPLTRQSEGLYTGTFTIEETDLFWGFVPVNVVASDGTDPVEEASASTSIFPMGAQRFMLDIVTPDESNWVYKPGETIEFTVEATFDGAPVEPDADTLVVECYDVDYNTVPIDLTTVSTGVYEAAIEVPSDLTMGMTYQVSAMADYTPAGETYSAEAYNAFYVDLLVLWLHYVEVTLTQTVVDIYVMDLDLEPVEGASISFEYSYQDASWEDITKELTGTTSEDGKASFTLQYSDIGEDNMFIYISGEAVSEGMTQTFHASVTASEGADEVPSPWMPLYVLLVDELPLPPDTFMDLHFKAYTMGNVLPNKDLFVYITDGEIMLHNGVVTTNAIGAFTVNVKTPPAGDVFSSMDMPSIDCDFQMEVSGIYSIFGASYAVMEEMGPAGMGPFMDPQVTVTATPSRLGETTAVTVDHPSADGVDEMSVVLWGLGDIEAWREPPYAQWVSLNPGGWGEGGILGEAPCTWSNGGFHADVLIPGSVPEGMNVFFLGIIAFGDPDDMDLHVGTLGTYTPLPPNPPPVAVITVPAAGEQYSGIVTATGTATDDTLVDGVEVRMDGGAWTAATGTDAWSFIINTTELASGTHMLEARAYDGDIYSTIVSVTFEVDQPPTVVITTPAPGLRVNKTFMVGGTAADDNSVDRVEFRVDSGAWATATGTVAWTAEVDLGNLSSGVHTFEVRSSDGERTSVAANLSFVIDYRPTVTITAPVNASTLKKAFDFLGTAHDDLNLSKVEGRLDGGAWTELTGTTAWSWTVPVKGLTEGDHTLEVRVWDGYAYSEVASVAFKYKKPAESPGPSAALALLAFMGAVGSAHLTLQRRRR
jgi:hypothetical protein